MRGIPLIILLFVLNPLLSSAYAGGDPIAGQAKAAACEGCHGHNSSNPLSPKLAGQPAGYIEQQIVNYRDGIRIDPVMNGIAANLTADQDIRDIAAYYASLPHMIENGQKLTSTLQMGMRLYKNKCMMCHGINGAGGKINQVNSLFGSSHSQQASNAPLIGGQPKAYLIKSLNDFRSGTRKSINATGKEVLIKHMSDEQINLVAKYLSSLTSKRPTGSPLADRR